jgi:hypothetical protein
MSRDGRTRDEAGGMTGGTVFLFDATDSQQLNAAAQDIRF